MPGTKPVRYLEPNILPILDSQKNSTKINKNDTRQKDFLLVSICVCRGIGGKKQGDTEMLYSWEGENKILSLGFLFTIHQIIKKQIHFHAPSVSSKQSLFDLPSCPLERKNKKKAEKSKNCTPDMQCNPSQLALHSKVLRRRGSQNGSI